jgi:hypothetical protein
MAGLVVYEDFRLAVRNGGATLRSGFGGAALSPANQNRNQAKLYQIQPPTHLPKSIRTAKTTSSESSTKKKM